MKFDEFYKARDIIEDIIQKDFEGPLQENEVIYEEPLKYYVTSILYPLQNEIDESEILKDEDNVVLEEDNYYENTYLSNSYYPSSIGITTTVKEETDKVKINIKYAKYIKEYNIEDKKKYWKRIPYKYEGIVDIDKVLQTISISKENNLSLQIYVKKINDSNLKIVTSTLINNTKHSNDYDIQNLNSVFQANIIISSINENEAIFVENNSKIKLSKDDEIIQLDMLYSHCKNYAFGHGCSVDWKEAADFSGAYEVYTTFIPKYELKQMKAAIKCDKDIFNMKKLATESKEYVCNKLDKFIETYKEWIENQNLDITKLDKRYKYVANKNIELCREAYNRLKYSINLLMKNDIAFEAFQLTNQAMLNQKIQFEKRKGININIENMNWYPFQLAFLLQELVDIVEEESKFRDKVDLLWFPTGGGKTEAYLGVSAFTIFYRRLRSKENGNGVAIIMRYTLRLLTIQQFERAHALICACELLRKEKNIPGNEISIGLYVGSGLTPNSRKDAKDSLNKLKEGQLILEGNPCQVLKCPWCGEDINHNDYYMEEKKLKIKCRNKECEFSNGLPVYVVDEDIYDYKPTLIISTVDKLARMTWEARVGELFAKGIEEDYRPPELIIQDELHLISGPLGSITGLYEIAVRKLCEYKGIRAKTIASTATIRNASQQIAGLYGQEYKQFPPSGISIKDSYFAEEADRDEKPARKYIGLFVQGKSGVTTQIRLYSVLLFAVRYLKDLGFKEEVIDNFWTITAYFNTLKELGSAVTQVYDNVQDRYRYLYNTKFSYLNPKYPTQCEPDELKELNSRKSSAEISEILKQVEIKYPSKSTFDFLLASNMISVGIDISRLGLMTIINQPKTNSEYIQASSRVGRSNPGLVYSLYNPLRSRDKSHYEQFKLYHESIYKHVECTSVTPFSSRARDKALHAVYISLCRNLIPILRENSHAKNILELNIEDENKLKNINTYIIKEVENIICKGVGLQSDRNMLESELQEILTRWIDRAEENQYIKYQDKNYDNSILTTNIDDTECFFTLNSMRNVDAQSNIYVEGL